MCADHGAPRPGEQSNPPVGPTQVARAADPPAVPGINWSHTRDTTLGGCPRPYYHRYYGSRGGWRPDAPAPARAAFRLKHLTSLDLCLGTAVHECARWVATCVRDRAPVPGRDELAAVCRAALNRVWAASKDLEAFRADPARRPVLRTAYYGEVVPEDALERVRGKLSRCLDNLLACPLWPELADSDPAAIRVVDSLVTFDLEGRTVYAAPDLVYEAPGGAHIVCDWKTGRPGDAEAQVALYGLYAMRALGASSEGGGLWGRVFLWGGPGGELCFHLDPEAIARAEARFRASVGDMEALLADPRRDRPLPITAFPLAPLEERGQCRWCNYHEICRDELEDTRKGGGAA